MELQSIDLSLFTKGNDCEKSKFASDLLDSISRHGVVRVVNHGVSEAAVSELWEMNKSFFQLPAEEKQRIAHEPGPNPQRGWSTIGAESSAKLYQKGILNSEVKQDLKDAREHFDMGPKNDIHHPNQWPEESQLPGFRATMESTFDAMEAISDNILEALEMSLELPQGTFRNKVTHQKNASEFRFNHYPTITIEEMKKGLTSRIWPHFDLGVITLLFQDNVGGLQFENREKMGTFGRISCESSSDLIINVSETLQRWTNDRLPAGLHQVVLPEDLEAREDGVVPERYSIAYFCKADRDAMVGPLEAFLPADAVPHYKNLSAIEYQMERLLSAY